MTNEIPAPEGADLRAAAQKALDMLAGAHWGKVPYMDGLVYEHASQVAETLRAALAAQPAQEQRSQFCPICEARGRADASPAEAHGLDELRRDLIADTREVFYASGSETPQSVRDVIEYVDSWLQVQVGRAADSAKTKHATKCLEGMLEDDEGARYSCTCGAKKPPTRGQLFTALNEIAQLVGDCEEWAITEDPQVVVSMVKDYMAGVALANVQPKGTPKPCLVSGDCKHGAWCSDVYCQERCQFVKGTDALDALAELCDMATGGWDLPPSAVCRIGALARKARAAIQAPAVGASDAARLDWLEQQQSIALTRLRISAKPDATRYWCITDRGDDDLTDGVEPEDRQTLRAAIDAAMVSDVPVQGSGS